MALSATRLEYRVALANVDRGRELSETVIVARHPSETQEHATLRVLAWCLLNEERLTFGPGLSTPDAADLWTHDLTGQLTTWVECGATTAERVRKLQQHHPGLGMHVVVDDPRRAQELAQALAALKLPRGATAATIWTVEEKLVLELAAKEERRQKWAVTVVGDHLYVDADGKAVDAAVSRTAG
jgi:uncharacterized protein YaeQ